MATATAVAGALVRAPDDTDLNDLVAAARRGDEVAFARLYRHFAERVFRFCLFRAGRPSDAEDLTQQVFLHVIEALPRYEDRGTPFAAWLFRIARNVTIDFRRAHRDQPDLDAIPVAFEVDRRDDLAAAIERDTLFEAMDGLTRDQRDVIWYRYFADLSTSEIAGLMERDEVTVRSLQARAIAGLRRRLDDDGVPGRRQFVGRAAAGMVAPVPVVRS